MDSFFIDILKCEIKIIVIKKCEMDQFMYHLMQPMFYSNKKNKFCTYVSFLFEFL